MTVGLFRPLGERLMQVIFNHNLVNNLWVLNQILKIFLLEKKQCLLAFLGNPTPLAVGRGLHSGHKRIEFGCTRTCRREVLDDNRALALMNTYEHRPSDSHFQILNFCS